MLWIMRSSLDQIATVLIKTEVSAEASKRNIRRFMSHQAVEPGAFWRCWNGPATEIF